MKEIIEAEINKTDGLSDGTCQLTIEYQKGHTKIKFPLQPLTDIMLFDSLEVLKSHIEHVRIVSFEKGHYSFQALNSNIFNTENITDNFRIDFFSLINSYAEISRKGELTMEEINAVIGIYKKLNAGISFDPVNRLKSLGASIISSESAPDWDYIAGYTEAKRKIRESVILPLKNPETYNSVMQLTRKNLNQTCRGRCYSKGLQSWEKLLLPV
jgi:hypothetical protein